MDATMRELEFSRDRVKELEREKKDREKEMHWMMDREKELQEKCAALETQLRSAKTAREGDDEYEKIN